MGHVSETFFASRSQRNPCLVKLRTLEKAAMTSCWPNNPLSRSMSTSPMAPASRSLSRQLRASKQSPQWRNPHCPSVQWHGSGSPLPPLTYHPRWTSALVGLIKETLSVTVAGTQYKNGSGFSLCANVKLCSDSPMDMSVIEGEEKPANVNEAPEYAAEIHTYLREMEVRKFAY